ncbi:MAG: BglG family transcription antiterminator [Eubacteriaceae bacterium]
MQLTKRQSQILNLLDNSRTAEAAKLSQMLDISQQTFKAEIKTLEPILEKFDIYINWLPGSRLAVRGRENFSRMLTQTQAYQELSNEDQILLMLVLSESFLTIQEIADRLYMSKSYTEKALARLLDSRDDIESLRHYGIRFSGDHLERSRIFCDLLVPYITGADFEIELRRFNELHFPLLDYVSEESIQKAEEAIAILQADTHFIFADDSVVQLFLHLLFILTLDRKPSRRTDPVYVKIISDYDQGQTYLNLVENLNENARLDLTENNRYYIAGLLMSLRKQRVLNNSEIQKQMQDFIKRVFRRIKTDFDIDFESDEQLWEGLSLHIYTTAVRRSTIETYADEEQCTAIMRQYPLGFEMAITTSDMIEAEYGYHLDDNEKVYIALHYQAALERRKKATRRIRTTMVCHMGFAAANLITTKLERKFPNIEFVHTWSLQEYLKKGTPECDLIITTESIPETDKPVIYLSAGLTENELGRVRHFVDRREVDDMLLMVLHESELIDLTDCHTPEAAIERLGRYLEDNGYVREGYTQTMQDREKISSTALKHLAVPHGNPSMVDETKLLVGTNRNGIPWDGEKITCTFLYAFNTQVFRENNDIYTALYRRLASNEVEQEIYNIRDLDGDEFKRNLIKIIKE